jgi:MFS family permease
MPARAYSRFDLGAAIGTAFVKNACLTLVLPAALSSAESRSDPSTLGTSVLTLSGLITMAFPMGMVLSTSVMLALPQRLLDTRLPFVLCGFLLLIGSVLHFLSELFIWPLWAVLLIRFSTALGFGAQFVGKRRAAVGIQHQFRREWAFMQIELANSLGQVS